MALVNYYLTDSEGDSDDEEDTHVRFSPPTPVTADVPPVGPPTGPRHPHWLPPVRPLAGPPPVWFSAPTPMVFCIVYWANLLTQKSEITVMIYLAMSFIVFYCTDHVSCLKQP